MNRRGFLAFLLGAPIAAKMAENVYLSTDGAWTKVGRGPWHHGEIPIITYDPKVRPITEAYNQQKYFLASEKWMKALNNGVFD